MFVHLDTQAESLYARVGGDAFFFDLVQHFYTGVESDAVLRPLYPADLEPPKRRLALFLIQYWGGPSTYSQERGHPRLRMRHVRFRIGVPERQAWLRHMRAALDQVALDPAHDAQLWEYLVMAAHSLVNKPRESGGPDLGLTPA